MDTVKQREHRLNYFWTDAPKDRDFEDAIKVEVSPIVNLDTGERMARVVSSNYRDSKALYHYRENKYLTWSIYDLGMYEEEGKIQFVDQCEGMTSYEYLEKLHENWIYDMGDVHFFSAASSWYDSQMGAVRRLKSPYVDEYGNELALVSFDYASWYSGKVTPDTYSCDGFNLWEYKELEKLDTPKDYELIYKDREVEFLYFGQYYKKLIEIAGNDKYSPNKMASCWWYADEKWSILAHKDSMSHETLKENGWL